MAAKRITNAEDGWRVRTSDGEFELSLTELRQWIREFRVIPTHEVRPPTTKRWKLADNAVELQAEFDQMREAAREKARAEAAQIAAKFSEDIRRKAEKQAAEERVRKAAEDGEKERRAAEYLVQREREQDASSRRRIGCVIAVGALIIFTFLVAYMNTHP